MRDRGVLSVAAVEDHLELDAGGESCIRIDITDTGQGIPEDKIDNIFEPFYTTKASGTGLGLPLVLNTIRNHGGVIQAHAKNQHGATFSLYLPLEFNQPLYEDNGKNINH
jgi:signal transduction histidine kinase